MHAEQYILRSIVVLVSHQINSMPADEAVDYRNLDLDFCNCYMQMTHYAEDEHGVTLHFDQDQTAVHAKLLVGADGYFSKVRSQCLNDGPPTFNVGALLLSDCISLTKLLTSNRLVLCAVLPCSAAA